MKSTWIFPQFAIVSALPMVKVKVGGMKKNSRLMRYTQQIPEQEKIVNSIARVETVSNKIRATTE